MLSTAKTKRFSIAVLSIVTIAFYLYYQALPVGTLDRIEMHKDMNLDNVERPRATHLLLIKGDDKSVASAVKMLQGFDLAFNLQFGYPITVFHENDLTEKHKSDLQDAVKSVTIDFVEIEFKLPEHLDVSKIPGNFSGWSQSFTYLGYRHMCRFFSGQVFTHPALAKYDYYWRLDDDSEYFCPIQYDVFKFMKKNGIKYGWSLWFWEDPVIAGETLFDATKKYIWENSISVGPLYHDLLTVWGGYHRCHYWNNFEILDINVFRGKDYQNWFNYLDEIGGFYLYRWGDALVRTIGAHMFLQDKEMHRFKDIGYNHQVRCTKTCDPSYPCMECPEGICAHCDFPERYFRGIGDEEVMMFMWIVCLIGAVVSGRSLVKWYLHQQREANAKRL